MTTRPTLPCPQRCLLCPLHVDTGRAWPEAKQVSEPTAREREWKTTRPETYLEGRRRLRVRSLPTSFNDPNLSLGSAAISIWRTSGRLTLPASQSEQADRSITADARTLGRNRKARRGF